jgi:hypothetical protein
MRSSVSTIPRRLFQLMLAIIDDAMCDCEDLYGAPAGAIAQACVMLGNELYDLEDPRNADYFDVLACQEDEDLASFIGAVVCEALSLLPRPNEDRENLVDICDVNARRIVSDPKYSRQLNRRRAGSIPCPLDVHRPVLRVVEGAGRCRITASEKVSG